MASRTSTATSTKKPPKIKQACDCCHARKIRCDGASPCNNCQTPSIPCTYLLIPKKKGPKGPSLRTPRAVLKMRMNQEQSTKSDTSLPGLKPAMSPPLVPPPKDNATPDWSAYRGFEPSPLLSMDIVEKHIDSFFAHKYPVFPVLDQAQLQESMAFFDTSPEIYGLVTSLCAAISSQEPPDQQSVSSTQSTASDLVHSPDYFMNEAKRAKAANPNYIEKPTLRDALTNFFLFAALFNLDRHNSAWFYLRESMTMLQMLRLHEEETYKTKDPLDALYSRRTFWLFFITERAYALQRHRPLTLHGTIELPTISPDDPDAAVLSGFLDLVSLFQHFDEDFVRLWNVSSHTPEATLVDKGSVISSKQIRILQLVLDQSIPEVSKRNEIQQADLLISKQWLRTMVWQLCVTRRLLSYSSKDESMRFHYPVSIARDVVQIGKSLHKRAFEPHGVGILEKIFDIGCSLADVVACDPQFQFPSGSMEVGPRDYLQEILRILSTVHGGPSKYAMILEGRISESTPTQPELALESGYNSKIINLDDEEDSFSDTMESSSTLKRLGLSVYPGNSGSDIDALSAVSKEWLGRLANDGFGGIDDIQPSWHQAG